LFRDEDTALDKKVLSLRERAGEAIGLDGPQELSLLVVNQGSDGGAMKWLESFNFDAEATGYMEMVNQKSFRTIRDRPNPSSFPIISSDDSIKNPDPNPSSFPIISSDDSIKNPDPNPSSFPSSDDSIKNLPSPFEIVL
jgi:hypothetical protein